METPELSLVQRLILANQFKIMAHLDIGDDQVGHQQFATVVAEGYTLEYPNLFEAFQDPVSIDECTYVRDVMDMYRQIQHGFDSATDTDGLEERDLLFHGFDGNSAGRLLSYAKFLVGVHLWSDVRTSGTAGDLNSHGHGDGQYSGMLEKYVSIGSPNEMSIADIKVVLGK